MDEPMDKMHVALDELFDSTNQLSQDTAAAYYRALDMLPEKAAEARAAATQAAFAGDISIADVAVRLAPVLKDIAPEELFDSFESYLDFDMTVNDASRLTHAWLTSTDQFPEGTFSPIRG